MMLQHWKTVWQFLERLNIQLSYDPAILYMFVHMCISKRNVHIKIYTWMFISELFIIARRWKQSKYPSMDE